MSDKALQLLPTESEWTQLKEIASMAVRSGLLPSAIRSPEQAAIIALKGRELGLPPMVAFAHINVIQGKPCCSSELMLAYIRKDFPQAEIVFAEATDQKCVLKAKRPGDKEYTVFTWDLDRAKKMNLLDKDNWKKQAGTMMRWRCVSEMKRFLFPESLMGLDYTPEELEGARDVSQAEPVDPVTEASATTSKPKSIKNHAPQTSEEAKAWTPEVVKNPDPLPEIVVPSRDDLIKEAIALCRKLGAKNLQEIDAMVIKTAGRTGKDLSDSEVSDLIDILKIELTKKKE